MGGGVENGKSSLSRRLMQFLENSDPAWRECDHPEFAGENSAQWVRRLRAGSERRANERAMQA
jgi:hypothetical protein